MPEKKYTYGKDNQARAYRVLQGLLNYRDSGIEERRIECLKTDRRLTFEISKTDLIGLVKAIEPSSDWENDIRPVISHYLTWLGIFHDNRTVIRGSSIWKFSLDLWSEDTAENLRRFNDEWVKKCTDRQKKVFQENITYDKTQKSIRVFISHNNNEEDNIFTRKIRNVIENGGYGIKFWQEIEEGKSISDKKAARKENINKCDCFLVIVSQQLLGEFERTPRISEELGLAYSLSRSSSGERPKIIFLCKDLEDISSIEIAATDFNTGVSSEHFKIRDWDKLKISTYSETENFASLVEMLLPPITFIDNLDEDPERDKWFQASQIPYEEEFFPVVSERLPFDEISNRIRDYNGNPKSEWREVYAVWHFKKNTENLEYSDLAKYVIGMGYVCVHLPSGWCFGNYIAIKEIHRVDNRVNFLAEKVQQKIQENFVLKERQLKGIIFDVEPIDFEFLIQICTSKEKIAGSGDNETTFLNELRQLLRVHWFLTDRELKNVYIILENTQQNINCSSSDIFKAHPFSYIQPGMDAPVEENDTPLFLMVYLFEEDLSKQENISREIIEFLFDNLFPSGSDETGRAEGYHENVEKIKLQMLQKHEQSNGYILGKIENIYVGDNNYDLRKLKKMAHSRANREGLSSQLKF